jgi:hypothetical protein
LNAFAPTLVHTLGESKVTDVKLTLYVVVRNVLAAMLVQLVPIETLTKVLETSLYKVPFMVAFDTESGDPEAYVNTVLVAISL